MKYLLTATALLAFCACGREEESPVETTTEPSLAEGIGDLSAAPPDQIDPEPITEVAMADCPVLDSRNWKAWTASDGTGTTLHVAGEVDYPTPGYETSWRLGPTDRAMPPGQRVYLDATAPGETVAQVVTPTPVTFQTPGAYVEYRTVIVLCGDTTLAEISPVGVE